MVLALLPTTTASKTALSIALQHGFIAVLLFALLTLIVAFFLKEKHIIATPESLEAASMVAEQTDEESNKELVHA